MNVAAATRATFLPDQLGSVIAAFDSTSGGLTKTGYQAYGTSPSVSTPFGYTGQRFDPENTFYYYRARNYSTAYGRFLQTDPSGAPSDASGGYAAKANLYTYVLNDPLNNVDPQGLYTFQLGITGGGTFFGFIVPQGGFGVAIDTSGNIGTYAYSGIGVGAGVEGDFGGSLQFSNAETIYDLSGAFANTSLSGGAVIGGSVDLFTGTSQNGQNAIVGGGITFGAGAGASASVTTTGTQVCGSQGCFGSFLPTVDIISSAEAATPSPQNDFPTITSPAK
jgi:RHS repeat-associated protein